MCACVCPYHCKIRWTPAVNTTVVCLRSQNTEFKDGLGPTHGYWVLMTTECDSITTQSLVLVSLLWFGLSAPWLIRPSQRAAGQRGGACSRCRFRYFPQEPHGGEQTQTNICASPRTSAIYFLYPGAVHSHWKLLTTGKESMNQIWWIRYIHMEQQHHYDPNYHLDALYALTHLSECESASLLPPTQSGRANIQSSGFFFYSHLLSMSTFTGTVSYHGNLSLS